jgi:hypothetical protein
MLGSLGEAGGAVLDHLGLDAADGGSALLGQVEAWERLACRTFYRSYRKGMAGHPSCPASAVAAEALVTLALAQRSLAGVSGALARHALNPGGAMRRLLHVAQHGR